MRCIYSWALTCTRHVDQKGAATGRQHGFFGIARYTQRMPRILDKRNFVSSTTATSPVQRKSDGQWSTGVERWTDAKGISSFRKFQITLIYEYVRIVMRL